MIAAQRHRPDRQPGQPDRPPGQDHHHRPVDRVPADHVPQLVAEQAAQLLVVEQLAAQPLLITMNGLAMPMHIAVDRAVVLHVQLGQLGHVERRRRLGEEPVDPRVLPVIDPDRAAEELQPPGPLVPQRVERLEHVVEAAQLAQRGQRAPVGRVLPGPRADAGQRDPPPRGRAVARRGHPSAPASRAVPCRVPVSRDRRRTCADRPSAHAHAKDASTQSGPGRAGPPARRRRAGRRRRACRPRRSAAVLPGRHRAATAAIASPSRASARASRNARRRGHEHRQRQLRAGRRPRRRDPLHDQHVRRGRHRVHSVTRTAPHASRSRRYRRGRPPRSGREHPLAPAGART